MPLSSHITAILIKRLSDVEPNAPDIRTVGPDLRCERVEDAERLEQRVGHWIEVFVALTDDPAATSEDRTALSTLVDVFDELRADLQESIRQTRDRGIPWEQTKTEPRHSHVAVRAIQGSGTIDPELLIPSLPKAAK